MRTADDSFKFGILYEKEGELKLYPGEIYNADKYSNFFFDTRGKTEYVSCFSCLFGQKPDGSLDMFNIHGNEAYPLVKNFTDFKLVQDFTFREELSREPARLVLERNGLYKFYPYSRDENYLFKEVYYAYHDFYRVQFKDGSLGWATKDGRQFPDPKN